MSAETSFAQPRPGGRSARVQAAVHRAVASLTEAHGRETLTVPAIAAAAGVTPSTIYRRWGDLAELLADVAVARLRPEAEPADTGSTVGDLLAWAQQYLDEMSSEVGRSLIRDALAGTGIGIGIGAAGRPVPCRCAEYTAAQIRIVLERGRRRGERGLPSVDAVVDCVVGPIVYRVLFDPPTTPAPRIDTLVERSFDSTRAPPSWADPRANADAGAGAA